MKLLIAAALMLMLCAVSSAVPDSQQVGPYTVSFDLNANYQPQIAQPMETEAVNVYSMRLFVDNSTQAVIEIAEYPGQADSTLEVHKSLMRMSMLMNEGLNATNMEDRVIDGKQGFLLAAEPFEAIPNGPSEIYRAMYWLDSQDCECGPVSVGTTSVIITSTYPLDVTNGLLSSLQVVKGQAAAMPAMPSGGQVLPPE